MSESWFRPAGPDKQYELQAGGSLTTWGLGDYPEMAEQLESAAMETVHLAKIGTEDKVVDLCCGTGNASIAAARHGARTVGIDTDPRLIQIARERADGEDLDIDFLVADAQNIGEMVTAADVVLSIFGVMYCPRAQDTLKGIGSALRPGGRAFLGAWDRGSVLPEFGKTVAPYLPEMPRGELAPTDWSDPSCIVPLLDQTSLTVGDTWHSAVHFEFDSVDAAVDFFIRTAGHVVAHRESLCREGSWSTLRDDVRTLLCTYGIVDGDNFSIRADYSVTCLRRAK